LDDLPLDQDSWYRGPLKFVLQILKISILGGSIPKCGLKLANDDLAINAKVGIASIGCGVLIELFWIVQRRNTGRTCITINIEAFWQCWQFVGFLVLVA